MANDGQPLANAAFSARDSWALMTRPRIMPLMTLTVTKPAMNGQRSIISGLQAGYHLMAGAVRWSRLVGQFGG